MVELTGVGSWELVQTRVLVFDLLVLRLATLLCSDMHIYQSYILCIYI